MLNLNPARTDSKMPGLVVFGALIWIGLAVGATSLPANAAAASFDAEQPTVLITGETGTGKELVARALHYESERKSGPFVAVNCGAIAENLVESHLFGHEKGSFPGATGRHKGKVEAADGGTLLLDEVGELPQAAQTRSPWRQSAPAPPRHTQPTPQAAPRWAPASPA